MASRSTADRRGWSIVVFPVLRFVLAGVVALVIVGLALSVASRRLGEREAITNARSQALSKAQGIVEPLLTAGVLDGDPEALDALDRAVRSEVLDDAIVRVKLWRPDGTIIYSDEPELIGDRYELDQDERDAIAEELVEAEVSDLRAPENRFERSEGKLLEVYLPLFTSEGEAVLFESYSHYEPVEASGRRIWRSFAPLTLGSLLALQLVQVPLAFSLASKLRTRQLEREDLLNRAINASEYERRRIARDLHDGVVQDLAGVSYSLAAASRTGRPPAAGELAVAAGTVRASIEALRTLLVEIYPPNLAEEGLGPALDDLLARARSVGLRTELDLAALPAELTLPTARLVYRTVQEAVRNVVTHAQASSVVVRAAADEARVWAEVVDDGVGFDVDAARAAGGSGHVGLLGLTDLTAEAGGELTIDSKPGGPTTVRVEVPLP